MTSLSRRIKSRRVLCWLSQEEFARRVGVSRRQVLYWESNDDAPSVETLGRICDVLHVSADWLLKGKGWLRDVYDEKFYRQQQDVFVERTVKRFKIRLFGELPLNFAAKSYPAVEVLDQDDGAIALVVKTEEFEPHYMPNDLLLMRPLNIQFNSALSHDPEQLGKLNDSQIATVLNGKADLSILKVKPAGERRIEAQLTSLRRGSARKIIRANDELLLQAVVYKCVRTV